MTAAAPRIDDRLRDELRRLAHGRASAADARRALVRRARELELAPPSYEHVRRLLAAERFEHRLARERTTEIVEAAARVAFGFEHGTSLPGVMQGAPRRRR